MSLNESIPCNKCGKDCVVWHNPDTGYFYAHTIKYDAGYHSYNFSDTFGFTMNLCEGCLVEIGLTCEIPPAIHCYGQWAGTDISKDTFKALVCDGKRLKRRGPYTPFELGIQAYWSSRGNKPEPCPFGARESFNEWCKGYLFGLFEEMFLPTGVTVTPPWTDDEKAVLDQMLADVKLRKASTKT